MNRPITLAVLALACLGAWCAFRPSPRADAVAPAQVVGTYKLRLKGDGFVRSASDPYRIERISGTALLQIARTLADDTKVQVTIQLDKTLTGGIADLATPKPDFAGEGYIVGDSLTIIDTGGPTYVNALTLTFLKDGERVAGHWLASFPATDPAKSTTSGVGIDFAGRRLGGRKPLSSPSVR